MRAFGQSDVVLSDLGPDAAFRRGPRRLPAVGRGTRPTRLRSGAASARARRPRNAAAVSGERRRPSRLLDPCRCRDRPGRDCAAGNKGLQSTDARERSVVLRARRHRNSAPPPPERPACWRGNRGSAQLRADVSQCSSPRVHRSRAKTRAEDAWAYFGFKGLHRCHECGWRGWGKTTVFTADLRSPGKPVTSSQRSDL